jgi:hypothetical protein
MRNPGSRPTTNRTQIPDFVRDDNNPTEEIGMGSKIVPTKDHPVTQWLQQPGSLQ